MNEELIRYVQQASTGNTDAMARLYSGSLKESYYLALKLTGDGVSAVEITKKAYARAFCTIQILKKPEAFGNWMKHNVATVYKETQNFDFSDIEEAEAEGSLEFLAEDVYTNGDKATAAMYAVDNLGTAHRTMLVLHYFSGMPVSSLAKHFGTEEGVVNTLLSEAKAQVSEACANESFDADSESLPVLTRLFQLQMDAQNIPGSDVKDVFAYAIGIYNSFKQVESKKAEDGDEGEKVTLDAPISFEPSIPSKTAGKEDINDQVPSEDIPYNAGNEIDFDAFTDSEPANTSVSGKPKFDLEKLKRLRIGKYGIKQIGICAAAVLVVLILIITIAASAGKKKDKNKGNNDNNNVAVSAEIQQNGKLPAYQWVEGGFSECTEISYLDEHCAKFRSAQTGKYGLLSYDGKVLLEPNYDDFIRCGFGRDYDSGSNYHTLVVIDNEQYYVKVENGKASIQPNPHGPHSMNTSELDKEVKYDDRDRYFNGYAAAEKKGKWGYVSQEDDKKVINFEYEPVNKLDHGESSFCDYCRPVTKDKLIPVKKNGMMGIINIEGKTVVPFEYTDILVGLNGIFIAQKGGTWGVILVGDETIKTFTPIKIEIQTEMADPDLEAFETERTYFCIAYKGANVRKDAGTDFEKVGELVEEDEVTAFGTKQDDTGRTWLKIRLENGTYGYVISDFMKLKQN